jgi:lipopolysaccharide/colanic/teichoic acid biosynthesis glycosyltransferase
MRYLERYSEEQSRRHDVLPGISGWAQINGRNNVSWEAKFELDVWYVNNWSIWLDQPARECNRL